MPHLAQRPVPTFYSECSSTAAFESSRLKAKRGPRIAVIGSGLAGGILAAELGKWATVTVFERGPATLSQPVRPISMGHPSGLGPAFAYGLGGTTNLWRGCLLAMRPDEYKGHWPADVREDIGRYQPHAIRMLYGETFLKAWDKIKGSACSTGTALLVDAIMVPVNPARVRTSNFFAFANLELGQYIDRIEEIENGVALYAKRGNDRKRIVFDFVVIAAGGLNSPLVLRRSSLGGEAVANNITDHPMGFVAKVTRRQLDSSFERLFLAPYSKRVLKVRDAETGLWSTFQLCPTDDSAMSSDPYAESFKASKSLETVRHYSSAIWKLRNSEYRRQAISKLLRRPRLGLNASVLVYSEQEPFGQGTIHEDANARLHLHWVVSDRVVAAVGRSLVLLGSWLNAELRVAPDSIRNRLWPAYHHSGACRISYDPKLGVVDNNLRVHGTTRVFVCDGSVLPSTGASNTGLAIAALAVRLAAYLTAVSNVNDLVPREEAISSTSE